MIARLFLFSQRMVFMEAKSGNDGEAANKGDVGKRLRGQAVISRLRWLV